MNDAAKKILLIVVLALAVAAFFYFDLDKKLTLENIKQSQAELNRLYEQRPFMLIAAFVAVYIPMVTLSLPGATVLALAAGAMFGALVGTIVVSFASTIGATFACTISRYLLRDWVQRHFGDRLVKINEGIRREGAFYLFSMRLIPIFPFFVINLVMGLTGMPLRTFYWVSQVGMLAGTFVFVNAGSQIAQIDSLGGILSPQLLLSFALLGIFPLAAKKGMAFYRKKTGRKPVQPQK
jgi:uncharacterized membrane protein YdjX (TVP38/TMEM64 family)